MATSSRDRISVDLRGFGAQLLACANAQGVSPSVLVRRALADELARLEGAPRNDAEAGAGAKDGHRARLCLRMSGADAAWIVDQAMRAGLSPGAYVARLAAGVPAVAQHGYQDHVLALRSSTAEVATLSRNIYRLVDLLRHGDLAQARPYREMLDHIADDVQRHLQAAASVLAALAPSRGGQAGGARAAPRPRGA